MPGGKQGSIQNTTGLPHAFSILSTESNEARFNGDEPESASGRPDYKNSSRSALSTGHPGLHLLLVDEDCSIENNLWEDRHQRQQNVGYRCSCHVPKFSLLFFLCGKCCSATAVFTNVLWLAKWESKGPCRTCNPWRTNWYTSKKIDILSAKQIYRFRYFRHHRQLEPLPRCPGDSKGYRMI